MILQSLEELEAELNRRQFHPVYVVLGPEEYLSREALALLKRKILPPDAFAFNYAEFSALESSAREVIEAAQTYPMMSPRRLVLMTNLERSDAVDQDLLLSYLENPSTRSVLILAAADLDRRTALYRQLREKACVAAFPKLKGPSLKRWTENFLRREGYRISSASLEKFVDLAGEDLQSTVNELEKLLIYAGKERSIPESAVNDLIISSRQHTIFELTEVLGRRDRSSALRQLGSLLDSGEEALVIVTMMARHFRQILIAKDLLEQGKSARDAAAAAQVPTFVQDAFMRSVRAIDWNTAAVMYRQMAEADYRFKSSPADKRMLLESLVSSL